MDTELPHVNHATSPMGHRTERYLSYAGLVIGGALVLTVAWSAYRNQKVTTRAADQVHHTLLVRQEAEMVLSLLSDAEASQLGFLLTGDPAYLETYNQAVRSFPSHMSRLGELTHDNSAQQALLWRVNVLAASRLAELDEGIRTRKEQGLPAALQIVQGSRNKQFQSEIRNLVSSILEQDTQRDASLEASIAGAGRDAALVIFGGLGLALAMILGSCLLLAHANRRRDWEQFGQGTFWSLLALRSGSLPRGPRPGKKPPSKPGASPPTSTASKNEPASSSSREIHIAELL